MSLSNNGTNGNFLQATASLPVLTGDFSYTVWAAQSGAGGGGTFVSFEDAGGAFFLQDGATGGNSPLYESNVFTTAFPGGNFVNNVWNFYAVVHTSAAGGNTVLYRGTNGAALSTTALGAEAITGVPTTVTLFNEQANDEGILGDLLDFKVWSAALSAREVTNQYLSIFPKSRVGALERWIPMVDSGNGGEAYAGRGKNMTLTGALPVAHSMPPVPWAIPMVQ